MKSKIFLRILFIVLVLTSLLTQLLLHGFILKTFNDSLPFRLSYEPSFLGLSYIYFLPALTGFIAGYLFNAKEVGSKTYFINFALLFGLINAVPALVNSEFLGANWFNANASGYYLMLYPVLFLLGIFGAIWRNYNGLNIEVKYERLHSIDFLVALGFGILLFSLNLIPFFTSKHLVGADVYYHSAMSQVIANKGHLSQSPFFAEGKNHYLSIVYYLFAFIHNHAHISLNLLWRLYVPACSFIFIFFFYLFSRKTIGSVFGAIAATLLVFCWNQILWADPSTRIFSYTFLVIAAFLLQSAFYNKKLLQQRVFFLGFIISSAISAASHPEIALHILGILLIFATLLLIRRYVNKRSASTPRQSGYYLSRLDSHKAFGLMLLILSVLILGSILTCLRNYQVSQILIFNEIPLSYFQPVGAISLVTFLGAPFGIYVLIKRHKAQDLLIFSLISLFSVTFFYFSHLWSLYHRYFSETAYLGLAVAAALFYNDIWQKLERRKRWLLIFPFVIFLLASLVPKTVFIKNYAHATELNLAQRDTDLSLIRNSTMPFSVIMLSPDDIINRYIPFYSNRYIFAGSSIITKEKQWQVLSFCNGPFQNACDARDRLANSFFNAPSLVKLKNIRSNYKVDYLLLNKQTPGEINAFTESDIHLAAPAAQNSKYSLYTLKGIL